MSFEGSIQRLEEENMQSTINSLLELEDSDLESLLIGDPDIELRLRSLGWSIIHIPKKVLKEPEESSWNHLDSYYGVIDFYKYHKTPIERGGYFTHIFSEIQRIKTLFIIKEVTLDIITRKTAYLNSLYYEIEYISKRYNWSEGEEFEEIFLAKFENFIASFAELIITCINLYEELCLKRDKPQINKFEDILKFFRDPTNKLSSFYHEGINYNIDFFLYKHVRNTLVHNFNEIEYIQNEQNPILSIDNISHGKRKYMFKDYIENEFSSYIGDKTPNSFQKYVDGKFSYLTYQYYFDEESNIDWEKTKIGFKMEIIALTYKMLNSLFIFQRDLFENIKEQ